MIGNSPFLQGWQQEYMKAHGSMPPTNKVLAFLTEVIDNQAIPTQNKQVEMRLLDQMQRFNPGV